MIRKSVLSFVCLLIGMQLWAQNPILPPTAFIPDGEPHIFELNGEKRLFLYGSRDQFVTSYCGEGHDVWSAPLDDLTNWTCHGEIFHIRQVQAIGYGKVKGQHFGAPDCVYNPVTRKYYLYTFLGASYKMDGTEGPLLGTSGVVSGYGENGPKCVMAVSDSPIGPFKDPVMCDWPPINDKGTFDPSVLVYNQPDGSVRVYAYWGMVKGDSWAELDPEDMHTIIDGKTREPDRRACYRTLNNPVLNNHSALFEASSIKQVAEDKFVFIYSALERISALSYCYSNSPEGPWTYGGVIINNGDGWKGGNNHGSIVQVNGQWYVCYHRKTTNDYNRQAMMEPIDLKIEGDKVIIPQVEMTSQGVCTNGLNAFDKINMYRACYTNGSYIDGAQRNEDGLNPMVNLKNGNVVGFKYLNFGDEAKIKKLKLRLNIEVLQDVEVTVQVVLPQEANLMEKRVDIASFQLKANQNKKEKYQEVLIPIKNLSKNKSLNAIGGLVGKKALFFTFKGKIGEELCRIKEYTLEK